MAYTAYAQYAILFRNEADYQFALEINGGSFQIGLPPRTAATLFGVPFPYPSGDISTTPKYIFFPPGFTPGTEINHPEPSGVFLDDTVAEVVVPGQIVSGGGVSPSPDMILKWAGSILRAAGTGDVENPTPIPQRRWIGGVEFEPNGEGGSFSNSVGCREASRTIEGLGFAVRGGNTAGTTWVRLLNELISGYTSTQSWERFYIRLRVPGTSNAGIWRCHNSISNNAGAGLKYNSNGDISIYNINTINVETLIGTIAAPSPDVWHRLDILLCYPTGAPGSNGGLTIYLDRAQVFSQIFAPSDGMGATGNHERSTMGRWTATADNQVQYDIDDWINADWPTKFPGVPHQAFTDSIDWMNGSHVRRTNIIATGITDWTPQNPGVFNQLHNPNQALNSSLSSSTTGAVLDGQTDVPLLNIDTLTADFTGVSVGQVAAIVSLFSDNAGNTDGRLGYATLGGSFVMTTIDQSSVTNWNQVIYRPSGLIVPVNISPFFIEHTKSADGNASNVYGLSAIVEEIGAWGPEDIAEFPGLPRNWLHNCRYPNTPWALPVGPFDGPVFAVGDVYVGNDLAQSIELPAPCHYLWIRALSGGGSGVKWFGAGLGGHLGTTDRVVPNYAVRVFTDTAGTTKFTVAGSDAEINASGIIYQYIAFCDPGARFNLCSAFNRPSTLTIDTIPLADSLFLPDGGFVQAEVLGINSNTQGLSYKGPGNSGNTGTFLSGPVLNNWGSFDIGALIALDDILVNTLSQINYSLWRTIDTGCGYIFCQMGSYIGDGTVSKVIATSPTSGRFPLQSIVIPTDGNPAIMRDPSHAGANSCRVDTLANTTTGIIDGGKDSLTVGITLNALGVTYNYFIIPGSPNGWNNGIYWPGNCAPPGDQWVPPNEDIPDIAIQGEGGLVLDGVVPISILKDVSGIYTIVKGKRNDTYYTRNSDPDETQDLKIPDPFISTGYLPED